MQHELRQRLAVNVGYFRTWHDNFTVTDNLNITSAGFDEHCITAPTDSRLPNPAGQRLHMKRQRDRELRSGTGT